MIVKQMIEEMKLEIDECKSQIDTVGDDNNAQIDEQTFVSSYKDYLIGRMKAYEEVVTKLELLKKYISGEILTADEKNILGVKR